MITVDALQQKLKQLKSCVEAIKILREEKKITVEDLSQTEGSFGKIETELSALAKGMSDNSLSSKDLKRLYEISDILTTHSFDLLKLMRPIMLGLAADTSGYTIIEPNTVRKRTQKTPYKGHTARVTCLSVLPGDKPNTGFAFSGSFDKSHCLWSLEDKSRLRTNKSAYTPNNKVAFYNMFGHIRNVVCSFYQHQITCHVVLPSANSTQHTIVVGAQNGKLYRLPECLEFEGGHPDAVTCITALPEQKKIISGGADGTVRIWCMENRKCLEVLTPPIDPACNVVTSLAAEGFATIPITGLAVIDANKEKFLISGDGFAHGFWIWNLVDTKKSPTRLFNKDAPLFHSFKVFSDGDRIVTCGETANGLWSLKQQTYLRSYRNIYVGSVTVTPTPSLFTATCITVLSDQETIITASKEGCLSAHTWSSTEPECRAQIKLKEGAKMGIYSMVQIPDPRSPSPLLLLGLDGGEIITRSVHNTPAYQAHMKEAVDESARIVRRKSLLDDGKTAAGRPNSSPSATAAWWEVTQSPSKTGTNAAIASTLTATAAPTTPTAATTPKPSPVASTAAATAAAAACASPTATAGKPVLYDFNQKQSEGTSPPQQTAASKGNRPKRPKPPEAPQKKPELNSPEPEKAKSIFGSLFG